MAPTPRPRNLARPRLRPTVEQLTWISHRDRIGQVIDSYLHTDPPPHMREAVEVVEGSLRVGDHAARLT